MSTSIDFSQARFKHLNWKFRVRLMLDGKEGLIKDQIVSHKHCDLGKWFYAEGKTKYGHLDSMQKFEKEHENLHITINDIIKFKSQGNTIQAEIRYKDLVKISDTLFELLNQAELAVGKSV